MALTWTDISAITNRKIVPRMVDNFFKSGPLFVLLKNKLNMPFDGGLTIKQPIMYQQLNGGPTARGGTFDTSYVQTDTALEFNVKEYYVNVTLYGADNLLNIGPEAAMSNVESKMANAAETMAKNMGTDAYLDGQGTYSSTLALDGLYAACDDGSNFPSYGGITRSSIASGANNGINGYYASFTGKSLGLSDVQTAVGSATFGRFHPTVILNPQPVWDLLWSKIQPQQRFLEESSDLAKIGFKAQRFNGISVVVDQYAPSGNMFGINTEFLNLYVSTNRKYQFSCTGWKEAQNTDDVAAQYLYGGNLIYSAPRTSFHLVNISA